MTSKELERVGFWCFAIFIATMFAFMLSMLTVGMYVMISAPIEEGHPDWIGPSVVATPIFMIVGGSLYYGVPRINRKILDLRHERNPK